MDVFLPQWRHHRSPFLPSLPSLSSPSPLHSPPPQGIVKLALTVSLRAIASWPAMLLSALLSLSLGAAVLLLFPSSAPQMLLAAFVGADLIASGIGLMLVAMMASWGKGSKGACRREGRDGEGSTKQKAVVVQGTEGAEEVCTLALHSMSADLSCRLQSSMQQLSCAT